MKKTPQNIFHKSTFFVIFPHLGLFKGLSEIQYFLDGVASHQPRPPPLRKQEAHTWHLVFMCGS